MMNVTFQVGTLFDCNTIETLNVSQRKYESLWRQTLTGCKVLQLLQEICNLPITYVVRGNEPNLTYLETRLAAYPRVNDSIDIYARPMAIWSKIVRDVSPVHEIITWRYGFILRRPDSAAFEPFYSLPFTPSVWNCIFFMIFICTMLFFLLSKWEKHVIGGKWESTFIFELLVIISAHCQQYLHRRAILTSRRLAYFTFFTFSYVIYSFYTSNLLSNLVNDESESIDLEALIESNYYQFAELENIKSDLSAGSTRDKMKEHWSYIKVLNTSAGLEAVRTSKTALLTDYVPLYPLLKKTFKPEEICQLAEVDLYTNVKKYLFTSKNFILKDQLKIGILRAKESGILQRLLKDVDTRPRCDMLRQVHTQFIYILNPLVVLLCVYTLAVIILLAERVHYSRNRVWPYTE